MRSKQLEAHRESYRETSPHYEENLRMLQGYVRRVLSGLEERTSLRILSMGIGHRTVSRGLIEQLGNRLAEYVIIEGSRGIIDAFIAGTTLPATIRIEHALFEEYAPAGLFDAIEMGFVLEHVDDPASMLAKYREHLVPDGVLFIAVPNARSLHRLVGHAGGLLEDLYHLSTADLAFGHQRYFDLESLTDLVTDAGLRTSRVEGILFKPLTTAQLERLGLSEEILRAFDTVAAELPAISNAIFMEARLQCSS